MELEFIKYQGAGNDFVMIDGIRQSISLDQLDEEKVAHLCHRNYGIGADGLIVLQKLDGYDFQMVYYNSDGRLSSMCGNGGRCIIDMAHRLGYVGKECTFLAADGPHEGKVGHGHIELKMKDVNMIEDLSQTDFFLDTGSPHYVQFVDESLDEIDIVSRARAIRYNDRFKEQGTNVNFVNILSDGQLQIRTYERGVEDETLACGTGITAASLAYDYKYNPSEHVHVSAEGGKLSVKLKRVEMGWANVWLLGPAEEAFTGRVKV